MTTLKAEGYFISRFYTKKIQPILTAVTFTLTGIGALIAAYEIGTWYFCLLTECSYKPSYIIYTLVFTFLSAVAYTFTY